MWLEIICAYLFVGAVNLLRGSRLIWQLFTCRHLTRTQMLWACIVYVYLWPVFVFEALRHFLFERGGATRPRRWGYKRTKP